MRRAGYEVFRRGAGVLIATLAFGAANAAAVAGRFDEVVRIALPAEPLGRALRDMARETRLQILFDANLVAGKTVRPINGMFSPRAAFDRLLHGTALEATEQAPGVVVIRSRHSGSTGLDPAPRHRADTRRPTADPLVPDAGTQALAAIVVTAERRAEPLQAVPISISAYTKTQMDLEGVRSINDIWRLTPGVTFTHGLVNDNSQSSDIAIRGIDSDAGAATTGIYIDDTPIQGRHLSFGTFNAYPQLFDIERVEVLRGPQGTLFGSGSEGGTIRFITPEPGLESYTAYSRTELAATAHGGPDYSSGIAAGGPLIPGKLGFRASMYYSHEGGYVDRVDWHTGRIVDPNSNWSRVISARIAVKWAPTARFSLMPSVLYQTHYVNDTAAWWTPVPGPTNPTGTLFDVPLRNGNAIGQPNTDKFFLPAVRIEWNLGPVKMLSNTAYYRRRENAITSYSEFDNAIFLGNPFPPPNDRGIGYWTDDQENWTQEIRFQSTATAARVDWTAGVFYQHARESTIQNVYDPVVLEEIGVPPGNGAVYEQDPFASLDQQLAAYGQTDMKLTQRLTLTLGLRAAAARYQGRTYYSGFVVGPPVSSSGTFSEHPITPRFGLKYQINPGSMVYTTVAKGYRIGGANPAVGQFCYGPGSALAQIGLSKVPETYNSDSVWSYEVGSKNLFANRRVLLNVSAYYIDWRNIQQNVSLTACGFQFTGNLGDAVSKGFDVETQLDPLPGLSIGGTFSYDDAYYSKTVRIAPTALSIVQNGDHIAGSPWTVSAFSQADFPMSGLHGYARVDFQYHARQTARVPNQDPLTGGYALGFPGVPAASDTTIRAGLRWSRWNVSLFVNNLFDTRPKLSSYQDVGSPTGGTPLFYNITWRPRTIGLTAIYRY